ncbi:hypothetical protein [Oceanirhabdus seepicola]|uniref:Uncharacterized protein n=1 Tax=Oceanirhabdus seepicola TaxID=2828781 RepID=A0A9J6P480_9CLOT|nr:hypothetical protein [Oceanirhabdus seepicola]MCM1991355.1 hypothetical protein [Oceanirhabdus seepicola]
MAKDKNPRLQARVTPELKEIIDKMLEHFNMTQAEFIEKYLPTLFLALDKEKYLSLVNEVYSNNKLNDIINVVDNG